MKPKVLLVTTGGTISMERDASGVLVPCRGAEQLLSRVPEVRTLADVDVESLANLDSADVEPSLWGRLAEAISRRLADYDGFVVTHGTDTLVYTAAALSFMLQELGKPVVLTGAQVPLEDIGSDGRANLINAVRLATADFAEVAVVFGSVIMRGTRAKKTSAFDLQAFRSANVPALGTIGLSLKLSTDVRRRARRTAVLQTALEPHVALLPVYPGLSPAVLTYLCETHAGVVLEGYGAGNLPSAGPLSLVPAIRAATARGVSVVVCTQCLVGSTEMELYQVGKAALEAGAIPVMDMTPETALVKLMWVLGQAPSTSDVKARMQQAFAGELHVSG